MWICVLASVNRTPTVIDLEDDLGAAITERFVALVEQRAGARLALGVVGTDATSNIHGRNGEEFAYMVEILGATPMEAITIGTRNGARLLGMDKDIGTVEAGRFADLVAVPGNPISDIRLLQKPDFVMKGGEVVKSPAGR